MPPIDRSRFTAITRNLAIVVDLRLHDRCDMRGEHALAGHRAPDPRGKRASPARLFRCEIEAGEKPRRLREMRPPENRYRILPRGMHQLIDETFDDEDIVSRSDASPEAGRHAGRLGAHVFDMKVRRR